MRVQGEAAERRVTRPIALTLGALAAALLLYLYVPIPAPRVAAASQDDCVEIGLWSNGYHADLAVPVEIFPADHPLRRLFPQAQSFLIGWGDEAFYRSDGRDMWLGVDAVIPPSPSVMHVAYDAPSAMSYLNADQQVTIALSREGAQGLLDYLDRALVLDGGRAVYVAPGKLYGRSSFVRTRGSFHLFNVCNQWMARALRAAGININARDAWFPGPLLSRVRAASARSCLS